MIQKFYSNSLFFSLYRPVNAGSVSAQLMVKSENNDEMISDIDPFHRMGRQDPRFEHQHSHD
jgi:hypothetical protein